MMIIFRKRNPQHQDLEEQINRVINFTNLLRVSIFCALLVFYGVPALNAGKFTVEAVSNSFSNAKTVELYAWFATNGFLLFLNALYPSWQRQSVTAQFPSASTVVDISMVGWLLAIAGGIDSGFGLLILPFLVTSCLLNYGKYWSVHATYAVLLIVVITIIDVNRLQDNHKTLDEMIETSVRAVILCIACYVVGFVTSFSSSYLITADEKVFKHKTAFERISALNKVVLNQAQDAILVVDSQCRVWLCNRRANQYFPEIRMNYVFENIRDLVRRWRGQPSRMFETNMMIQGEDMNIRAIPVIQEATELLIVFIRAERERQSEAQSVKLASLGLLTANLAHEIRNPLSAIRQANGLLIENTDESDKMSIKLTGIIDKNIERVDKMIEEVSSLNKSDRISKENIQLREFWHNFRQEFILTHPKAAHCITSNIGFRTEVVFDPMHLQQILWNLCNNAWRHSSQQGKSAISVIGQAINSYQVSLMVFDDGGGVPDNVIPHLFEPFHTTQAHAGGTGLGLYVARELAHANKGDLRYLTDKKAFEIILPRANEL